MIRPLRSSKEIYAISFIFSLLFFTTQIFGQAIGDYRSQATGNWAARATWQICTSLTPVTWATPSVAQGYPGQNNSTANVTIWNGNTVTFNSPIGPTIASLQIGSTTDGTSGSLVFNNNRTLIVAGAVTIGNLGTSSSGAVTMTNGGTFSLNSIVVSNPTGSSFTPGTAAATDTIQFNATNTLPTTVFTSFNNIAFSGGTTTAAVGFSAVGSVIINAGATFVAGSFTHNVGGNWVNNGGTFTATGSTIDFNGVAANSAINGTAPSQAFNNIVVDKTGFTLNAAATLTTSLTVSGTLTVLNGTFNMQNAGSNVFAGLVTVNGGATWNNTGNSAVNIQNGITCAGTFTSGNGIYTFDTNIQSLTGTLAIKNVTVNGITLTNNNTLTVATALSGTGTLTQAASATLNLGGTSLITTLQSTNTGNTVNYTGAAQTIIANNYYNLTLSGSGTAIMQAGTTAIAGDFTMSGTVRTTTADNLAITGNLIIGDGTILTVGAFGFAVTGATTIGSGASGRLAFSSPTGTKTFVGLIRLNAGSSWINNGAANSDINVQGGITNAGTFTAGTGIYTFDTNTQDLNGILTIPNVTVTLVTLNNNNTLTVSTALTGTGTLNQVGSTSILNLAGTSTITALSATSVGNTVNYTGGAQTVFATNYYNLGLGNAGAKTLQTGTTSIGGDFTFSGTASANAVIGLTIAGNLNIGTGTTFRGRTFTHSIAKNFANNGTFTPNTSTMVFNGTSAQTIGGSTATTFANLTISNSSGVSLDDGTNTVSKTVNTNLTLLGGYLTSTSSNLLILSQGATATVANAAIEAGGSVFVPQSTSPFVNGPMRKIGTQAFVFPVGVVGTGCVPIGISAPGTATDAFDAEYLRSSGSALGTIASPNLYSVSICEHWTLERSNGSSTISVTGYWNENSPCNGETAGHYVTDLTTISLAHFDGTSWDNNSTSLNSSTVGSTISGGITWTGVSTFSPFALGNNTGSKTNPLAIKLDYFTAVKANGYNKLSWQAECTSSSNTFEAQRSTDGVAFTSIDTVRINNASDCSTPSTYNDYTSNSNNVYYRVKMTDASGVVSYSDVVLLSTVVNAIDFIGIAPNPVKNDATIKISSTSDDKVELVIMSLDGKQLQHSTIQVQAGANTVNLHASNLAKGVYILRGIFSGGQTHTIKFIKE